MKKNLRNKIKFACPYCNKSNLEFRRSVLSPFNKKEYKLFFCKECLLEFFTPLEFEDVYQTESIEGYSDFHKGRVDAPLWTKKIIEVLKKRKIDLSGKNILEIGSGDGVNYNELKKNFKDITPENYSIIELDEKSIKICRKRGLVKIYDFIFNAENSIKIKDKFDVIIATEVFEHQINPREFVSEIFSKLNNGGIVIFSVPNRKRFFIKQKEIPHDIPPHHFLRFDTRFFNKNFKKIIYCEDYSYGFKSIGSSSKIMSKSYFKNSRYWLFFIPVSFILRIMGKISGDGLIVIFEK